MPIDRIKFPDNTTQEIRDPRMGNARIFYGTCSSAAADLEKVVVCPDFTANDLVKGAAILVTFDNTSTAAVANVTMNVNSTGAFHINKIYNNGYGNLTYAGDLRANMTHLFVFSGGSTWIVSGLDYNANTTYSVMTKAQADAGTSTTGYRITPAILHQKILNMLASYQPDIESITTSEINQMWGIVTIISFYFANENEPRHAEEGMTWREWVNSPYNTDNIVVSGNAVRKDSYYTLTSFGNTVRPDDVIVASEDRDYYWWEA